MKIKILALVLVVLLPVLAVTATHATKPTIGTGTATLVSSTMLSSRTAGDNTIATFKNTFQLTGALTGQAVALERDVTHASSDKSFTTFQGEANFTSTAGEASSGTLQIHYVGINNGTFVHGQFVAGHGTGSLADFHGQGEFSGKVVIVGEGGMRLVLNYTLKWHIDPAATRTKHSA
jgi:hypothetical protein